MQIVIDIPDGCYEELNSGRFPMQDAYRLVAWIKNGIPLPKNHGRLIDADELDTSVLQAGFSYALTRRTLRYTAGEVRQKIADAPTIIEEVKADGV